MTVRGAGCLAATAAVALVLAGCGGKTTKDSAVALVGANSIASTTLAHWMTVLAPRHVVSGPPMYASCVATEKAVAGHAAETGLRERCRQRYRALQQRALSYLISSGWLSGEAVDRGMPVTDGELRARIHEREASLPNGSSEFQQFLNAIGRTASDLRLEAQDELASAKLRQSLLRREAAVTNAQVADYYRRNLRRFQRKEARRFYIVENIKTKADASRLIEEFTRGEQSIAKYAKTSDERFDRPSDMHRARTILKVIFAARPNVISAPVRVERFYFLVQVIAITPASVQTLAQVRAAIEGKIASERKQDTLARFIDSWRRKWTARTDCWPGYVVPKCRQYVGALTPEDPLSFS